MLNRQAKFRLRNGRRSFSRVYDDGGGTRLWFWTETQLAVHQAAAKMNLPICKAALERKALVSRGTIDYSLTRHPDVPWLRAYLCEGAEPPADVRSVTIREMQGLTMLFNHPAIMRRLKATTAAYDEWFTQRIFPEGSIAQWLLFLYGWSAPPGWLIITEGMEELRKARTIEATCAAAGIHESTLYAWRRDPRIRDVLNGLCRAARNQNRDPAERALDIHPKTLDAMQRFATAQTIAQSCRRACMAVSSYASMLDRAAKVESRDRLREFLDGSERGTDGKRFAKTYGWMGDRIFRPPPLMRRFIAQAKKLASPRAAHLSRLMELPCFEDLLIDLALPMACRGRRPSLEYVSRAATSRIATIRPDDPPCLPDDSARLEAALELCISDKQKRLLRAVAALTAGRADYWPVADVIVQAAGIKLDRNVYRSLQTLVERRALRNRAPKNGYRISGT